MKGRERGAHPEVEPMACSTIELCRLHLCTSDRGVADTAAEEEEEEEDEEGGDRELGNTLYPFQDRERE